MISLEDGASAVRIARDVIEAETLAEDIEISYPEDFSRPAGVFVTIKKYPSGDLRGCIGYPEPMFPLIEALYRSARSACHDPRFPDLDNKEVAHVTVEVTILTKPEKMTQSKEDIPKNVVIGRDGLIIELKGRRGLLLPQVPEEWGWNVIEYLENLSIKAGLPKDSWKKEDAILYSFQGEIFSETSPSGEIVRK